LRFVLLFLTRAFASACAIAGAAPLLSFPFKLMRSRRGVHYTRVQFTREFAAIRWAFCIPMYLFATDYQHALFVIAIALFDPYCF
jgi:hypothetical protein